ncbi:hypothetical protein HJC23_011933 [Cyclotella cryptica]|uniref:Uncharacterized protein n=1 Tax=Cyclotella cryptica TaxID=29204 RepID=A0ABD3QQW0_9STRA|eukprot:CCRYP_002968-RA/>CCRYP_002968-RA protein AED:0.00 eAED:0.00 QI:103/-1/1/1/-1/1/1/483/186
MPPSSNLDLTGRASEDEPTTVPPSTRSRNNQRTTTTPLNPLQSLLGPHLPNPLDLYQQFTPLSLLQLPFVLLIYILLQLPLHYNSITATADTIHTLTEVEWQARVRSVNRMERELKYIEREVTRQKREQGGLKGEVEGLRVRLGKIRERRERREEWVRRMEMERVAGGGNGGSSDSAVGVCGKKDR